MFGCYLSMSIPVIVYMYALNLTNMLNKTHIDCPFHIAVVIGFNVMQSINLPLGSINHAQWWDWKV